MDASLGRCDATVKLDRATPMLVSQAWDLGAGAPLALAEPATSDRPAKQVLRRTSERAEGEHLLHLRQTQVTGLGLGIIPGDDLYEGSQAGHLRGTLS
jgi:hypothetical protein